MLTAVFSLDVQSIHLEFCNAKGMLEVGDSILRSDDLVQHPLQELKPSHYNVLHKQFGIESLA